MCCVAIDLVVVVGCGSEGLWLWVLSWYCCGGGGEYWQGRVVYEGLLLIWLLRWV